VVEPTPVSSHTRKATSFAWGAARLGP
jgi:hypothetical protein